MKVFLSYSRRDEHAVRSLVSDLQRARTTVWLDEELGGGDAWWTQILEQIRGCDVFVIAVSDHSLGSKPCRAEIDYAGALGLPILPVQVGTITSFRTDSVFRKQYVDYRDATRDNAIELVTAVHDRGAERGELPDTLPEPPALPYEYLQRLGEVVRGSAELGRSAQAATVFELRTALDAEDDESVRADIATLLMSLRDRGDIAYAVVKDIDAILATSAPTVSDAVDPGPPRRADRAARPTPVVSAPTDEPTLPPVTPEPDSTTTPEVIGKGAFARLLCGVVLVSVATAWLRVPPLSGLAGAGDAYTDVLSYAYALSAIPGIVLLVRGRGRTRPTMTAAGCGLLTFGLALWPFAALGMPRLWLSASGLLAVGMALMMWGAEVRRVMANSYFAWGTVIMAMTFLDSAMSKDQVQRLVSPDKFGGILLVSATAGLVFIGVGVAARFSRRRNTRPPVR